MFGVWVKILKSAGILFINWKVTSKPTVPEVSIIHFCQFLMGVFDGCKTVIIHCFTTSLRETTK